LYRWINGVGNTVNKQLLRLLVSATLIVALAQRVFADVDFNVAVGDYDGDGSPDVLFVAKKRIVLIFSDVIIPIAQPARYSTFVLRGACETPLGGNPPGAICQPTFDVVQNPSQSIVNHVSWDFSAYKIHKVDLSHGVFGTNGFDFFVRALQPGLPSFQINDAMMTQLGSNSSIFQFRGIEPEATFGIGLGDVGVDILFEDRNNDGRLDLVISRNGVPSAVFFTSNFSGGIQFPQIPSGGGGTSPNVEADEITINDVWNGFGSALSSNNRGLAAQYFASYSIGMYEALLDQMGDQVLIVPSRWSNFTPIRIGNDLAVFAFTQSELVGDRIHTITFVREPGFGWRIQSF